MNPHASPWNRPRPVYIRDVRYRSRWNRIQIHVTVPVTVNEWHSWLAINQEIYIAKNTAKFRLRSHLDWAYYTPASLAQAINSGTVQEYYEIMLTHVQSDPNEWQDHDFEMQLKSFYAARIGRCSQI
jgi:hypothetical protein